MKKKIIVSLILAACCIMASIPTSADSIQRAIICDEHGPFMSPRCLDVRITEPREHKVMYDGYQKTCTYYYESAYTFRTCTVCNKTVITGIHRHGENDHTTNICGVVNSLVCAIDGFVYPTD